MNVNYIVYGDYVLTLNAAMEVVPSGAVAVGGSEIIEVGPAANLFKKIL